MRALLKKTSAFTAWASGDALFEVRDSFRIPVMQQQRTTKIQRRKREAPLIVQVAECVRRLSEQVLASVGVPHSLDDAKWDQGGCHAADIPKLGVDLDCRFQCGRGPLVIALPEGEHAEPETRAHARQG
jgi:hypothetical protein